MSGGPYGRGKAPERACMKRAAWPATDRNLWVAALTPADPFSSGGSRASHRTISNRNIERGYGRWLTFLSRRGWLDEIHGPADRIIVESVRNYVQELDSLGNKKNTILARLEELMEMAKVMDPGRDWGFLNQISSRVRARPDHVSTKQSRLVGADQLFGLGLELMKGVAQQATPLKCAILFRDGLLIALLALRPMRRRNLTQLTLGSDLHCINGVWFIVLPQTATKTHVTLEYDWPEPLLPALEKYLEVHRPVLMTRNGRWQVTVGKRLWVSSDGSPFTEVAIYDRIIFWTKKAFGRSIGPHLFRDAGATTLALNDPTHVLMAAPLLGHRTFNTTERSYIQAKSIEAHRKFTDKLIALRSSSKS